VGAFVESYGFSNTDELMLPGRVAEGHGPQMPNPKYTYVTKVAKPVLPESR
jgi:hypothetical protein